jgi:phosphoribosylglycinamide formyltransferase-1
VKRVAVLASGRGSNLVALMAAQTAFSTYRVAFVLTNVEGAGALDQAQKAGVEAVCLPSRGLPRQDHETQVLKALEGRSIDFICLAGYMRVLTPDLIARFGRPILNIHPSLLPAFPGLHAQRQALAAGVRWSGATVHFVDSDLDAGPIILQEPVPVKPDDTENELSARILETEHRLYPRAADVIARAAYAVVGQRVTLLESHDQREGNSK